MPQDQWTAIDRYLTDALLPHDEALEAALAASDAAGLPAIAVAPNQGRSPIVRAACFADATKFLPTGERPGDRHLNEFGPRRPDLAPQRVNESRSGQERRES